MIFSWDYNVLYICLYCDLDCVPTQEVHRDIIETPAPGGAEVSRLRFQ